MRSLFSVSALIAVTQAVDLGYMGGTADTATASTKSLLEGTACDCPIDLDGLPGCDKPITCDEQKA